MNRKTFIIAEAGVNHNDDLCVAKKMVDAAAESGADAVKFQTFKAENIVTSYAAKAAYQKTDKSESQYEMLKKLELQYSDFEELNNYCKNKKIIFLSSPFDIESIDFLNSLDMSIFKIPSGEITNLPYLRKVGGLKKRIVLSSGMSTLEEIKDAMNILVMAGTASTDITILHCNTEYPTPFEDVNLNAMITIRNELKVPVGYSDHTIGIEIPIAAVALGASVIEKHFTLNKNMSGPDHRASLDTTELKSMVDAIRKLEISLGDGIKKSSKSESKNVNVVRKSIVASRDIAKGEVFTENNLTTKRPCNGTSPMEWDRVIGGIATREFEKDEPIKL